MHSIQAFSSLKNIKGMLFQLFDPINRSIYHISHWTLLRRIKYLHLFFTLLALLFLKIFGDIFRLVWPSTCSVECSVRSLPSIIYCISYNCCNISLEILIPHSQNLHPFIPNWFYNFSLLRRCNYWPS